MNTVEKSLQELANKVLKTKPTTKGIAYLVQDENCNIIFEGTAKDVTQRVNSISQRVVLLEYDSSISLRDLNLEEGQLIIIVFDNNYFSFSLLNFSEFAIDNTDLIFKGE